MKHQKTRTGRKERGFTIVELLVVIVVIAILAAISIVSFRGIQERAKSVAVLATVDNWSKFIAIEEASGRSMPTTGSNICLGRSTDYPQNGMFEANECLSIYISDSNGTTKVSSTTYSSSALSALAPGETVPSGSLPVTTLDVGNGVKFYARGIIYQPYQRKIQYFPQVKGQCGRGESSNGSASGTDQLSGDSCLISV